MKADPQLERELKFRVDDLNVVRSRLIELDAVLRSGAALEINWVLDRDGELAGAGLLLRLRQDAHGARLTFKGKARFEAKTKIRREIEAAVENVDDTLELFRALGYDVARRYEKRREVWALAGSGIFLDQTPMGGFVEIEGQTAEAVSRRCGLEPESAATGTYLELYDAYRALHPEAGIDMVFQCADRG
jgi:predicted adenylyl cyclase CyaB